ncbi:MAG: GspE/PulE family protein [Ignavibacteria bacterium]|nr:GspE/PulE family protein [Ignavibacteria bacterium]
MSSQDTFEPSQSMLGSEEQTSRSAADGSGDTARSAKPFVNSFLEHLVRTKVISEEIATRASAWRNESKDRGKKSVIDILIDEFDVSRELLHDEVAKFYSFRIIDFYDRNTKRFPPSQVNKLLAELPESIYRLATKHNVIPFETAENQPDKLLVVTPNPSDRIVYDVARSFPYKRFEICYMKEKDWAELWRQITLDKQQSLSAIEGDALFDEDDAELEGVLEMEINRNQLVGLMENILSDAVRVGASDIHVVPKTTRRTEILFRIDGQLNSWYTIEDARAEAVVAVVKGRAMNLDRFERMAAQDGSAQKVVDNQIIRFRMSILPIFSRQLGTKFESVVIRILKDADASVSLSTIGFDQYSLKVFKDAISKPHGMVILTGPTGCGKSTTLIAALRTVMKPTLNTITVEDPVEYLQEGARQVKLNHKLSFDDAIRAILRHDPDIVMVGEIRDRITADIAVKLANTGHLTFTTLHTNDAPSVVSRLFKIGIEPFLLAQSLNVVVAQRLVRKLCERCKEPLTNVSDNVLSRSGFSQEEADTTTFFKPVGCISCVGGFKGRTAIHETLYFTQEIRDIITESGERIDLDALRQSAQKHGMVTLRKSGLDLIKKGLSTIEEVIANTTND